MNGFKRGPKTIAFLTMLVLISLALSGAVYAGPNDDEAADPAQARMLAAYDDLRQAFPEVKILNENGRVTRVYGTSFGSGASPTETAENFRQGHSELLSARAEELRPESILPDRRHTQPLMYNPVTGQYKFTLVYYTQYYQDIPVFRADLRLLVRNEPDYPLVLAASALRSLDGLVIADEAAYDAASAGRAALADNPELTDYTEPRFTIWAGYNNESSKPVPAFELQAYSDIPARWLYVIDATTGEVLYKEDLIIFEDVLGSVQGLATDGFGADICHDEVATPMPYTRVNIGSTIAYADENGSFVIPNAGTADVSVESRIWGQYFRVFNYSGSDALLTQIVTPPGPADFLHNPANNEHTRAEVNAYVLANQVHDMVLSYNPSYPGVSTDTEFPIYVNRTDGYCPGNAWYDPGDLSLNFCASGGGYPNTAFQSVAFHEYGHHLVNMGGSGQGQYGEGMADVIALIWSDDSRLGVGFTGNCNEGIRNADNTIQYPCTDEIHYCGQLLSGCVWDVRTELVALYPTTYMDTVAVLAINSIMLHSGTEITPQIAIDWLTLDDDDAVLENGTPHYEQICAGFSAHNMDCPEISEIYFSYPGGRPEIANPSGGTTFEVVVNPGSGTPLTGTGEFYYTLDGILIEPGEMVETSSNVYEVTLPSADCNTRIDWYVSADVDGGGTVSDPPGAPGDFYHTVAADEAYIIFEDNFNTDKGWTVSGSVSDGAWERGIPAGGGDRGDPPTDYDGSGYCYLTDNEDGNSDVDDGTTILTSPLFDLTKGDAKIHYARWYSNNVGADPNNDEMHVYISNDNGSNWTLVETVGPVDQASGGWYVNEFFVSDYVTPTPFMKLRFDASDLASGSVVEAAVDDVVVKSFRCTDQPIIQTDDIPDWTVDHAFSLQLTASGGLGLLTWSDKNGDLVGSGLTLASDGLLSGTPTTIGPVTFTALVEDTAFNFDEKVFSFTINDHIQITTTSLPDWTVGQPYSQTLSSTGGTAPINWNDKHGDLSGSGLALSTAGEVSGTPTVEGPQSFTAEAIDDVGDAAEQVLGFAVNPSVAIATTELPDGQQDNEYSYQLEATGGTGETIWSDKNGDLVGTGLVLSPQGLLTGTPTDTGEVQFVAGAADNTGSSDEASLNVHIGPAFICGDADGSGEVNIVDISFIINYLYMEGPAPVPPEAADVDASGEINIIDITVLIDFLYNNGEDLICP